MKVSLNELSNNQTETKAKINSQIKLCPQKLLKTVLRSNALNGPLCFYRLTWAVQKHKINTYLYRFGKNYVGLISSLQLRIRRSKNPAFVDHPKRSLMVQRLNVSLLSKSKDRLMVQRLKRLFVRSKYILQKKDKNNLTNVQFSKNYIGLISISQLRNT